MITKQQASDLIGATAYDPGGGEVGEVATVYLDQASGEPEWLTVTTGLFGPRQTFVPIARARLRGPREVEFDLDKDTITGAPNIDPDGELAGAEEARLFRHYGMASSQRRGPAGLVRTGGQADGPDGAGTVITVSGICAGCGRYYDLPAEADQVMRVAVQQDGTGRVLVQCTDTGACDERWSSIVTCFRPVTRTGTRPGVNRFVAAGVRRQVAGGWSGAGHRS